MRTKLNVLAKQALNEPGAAKSLHLFNVCLIELEVIKMSEKRMKDLEDEYIEDFFSELTAQLIVVGGTGGIVADFRRNGGEDMLRHCFPNGVEFRVHNRRVLKGKDDPLRKSKYPHD